LGKKRITATDLLIDCISLAEYNPSTNQTSKESIYAPFFSPINSSLEQKGGFVNGYKFAKV
jgi:hypothetical protein